MYVFIFRDDMFFNFLNEIFIYYEKELILIVIILNRFLKNF